MLYAHKQQLKTAPWHAQTMYSVNHRHVTKLCAAEPFIDKQHNPTKDHLPSINHDYSIFFSQIIVLSCMDMEVGFRGRAAESN